MNPLSFRKNPFFDNNSLHFSKQDRTVNALLAFFILTLPFFSLLPHTRTLLALTALPFLLFALRGGKRVSVLSGKEIFLLLFFATVAAGVFKKGAALPSLLALILMLFGTLPWLYGLTPRVFARLISFSSAACGAHALWEFYSGKALALWSDAERFGTLARVGSFFGNPNVLGVFLAVGVILSFDEARRHLACGGWTLYTLCFGLSLSALVLTYSRGAWLGTCFGFLVYFLSLFREKKQKKANIALALSPHHPLLSRALSLLSPDSSVSYRFSLWTSILKTPLSLLLFGVGEGKAALLSLLSPYMAAGLERIEHTHSLYFHILCAEGMLGLAFFLGFLYLRYRHTRRNLAAIDGALFAILSYGIFDDPLYSGQIGVLFWTLANAN